MSTFRKKYCIWIWVLLGVGQLAIPASMVVRMEYVHRAGESFRFRLAPFDPADPFRGRYMALRFELENAPVPAPSDYDSEEPCFATLLRDGNGFATIGRVTHQRPTGNAYILLAPGDTSLTSDNPRQLRIRIPLDRYYLNEERAPEVERIAQAELERSRKAGKPAQVYGEVKVHAGEIALTRLMGPDGPLQ